MNCDKYTWEVATCPRISLVPWEPAGTKASRRSYNRQTLVVLLPRSQITRLPSGNGWPCPFEVIHLLYHPGVSRPDNRSLVTKAESPDIRSPEVDYPPRLHKDEIHRKDTTPTKLSPKTADPTTKVRSSSERATSTGSVCDVGKKQPIKHSKSVSDTLSGGDCHQTFRCQHCVHDLSSSSDSGIELQPSLAPRRNSDPLLLPRHPGTSSNACGNPKGEKDAS